MAMRQEEIAHHEAAHAVVARLLNVGLTHVAIFPTGDHSIAGAETVSPFSLAHARGADPSAQVAALETEIKVLLAGPCADQQRHPTTAQKRDWADDFSSARSRAALAVVLKAGKVPDITPDVLKLTLRAEDVREANQLLGRLGAETQTLVSENWPAIVRVATALLKQRILTENDVDLLNQKATDISILFKRIHP